MTTKRDKGSGWFRVVPKIVEPLVVVVPTRPVGVGNHHHFHR